MSDTPIVKGFLNGIHAAVRWTLHTVLIPVICVVELLIGVLNSFLTQLKKI